MRIRVIWEGRTKDRHLRALQAEYARRIAHFSDLRVEEIPAVRRGGNSFGKVVTPSERRLLEKLDASSKILLDQRGREWTSTEFAEWLGEQAVRGRRELAFLVGGPEGFSAAFRQRADSLLSLSKMTLTSDWARTLLLEQIYRGFTILRGYPYARE
jgi:23S rRNA (pseudouridine1915-N3)-methyltransferase